jgi:nitronate monooxygenase
MVLANRLTRRLGIEHPIVLAPLDQIGGALAKAVSDAGGFGMLGGGHGGRAWLEARLLEAGDAPIGVGFITESLARQPGLLDLALAHKPKAVMLSFDDLAPLGAKVRDVGAVLIAQVHSLDQARRVLDLGVDIVVQGGEAGGYSLTPQVADLISQNSHDALLLAAGGIADGRGLAAALMLGADGVMIGARFSASREALILPTAKARLAGDLPSAGELVRRIAAQALVLLGEAV